VKGEPIIKDAGYLSLVRRLPCIVPGCDPDLAGGEVHHPYPEGTGIKCSDFDGVPICHCHHTQGANAVDGFNQMSDDEWWANVACMTREEAIWKTRQDVISIVERGRLVSEEKLCRMKKRLGLA